MGITDKFYGEKVCLFYTTKDFPHFLKNSFFFEPIKTYSIKVIEKIVNFI